MPTSIYFSGSISGGREDIETYRTIVAALEKDGHRVFAGNVIAQHVGAEGESLSANEIFDRDTGWIEEVARSGGVLVAEVSRPSAGVGYEIALARYRFGMPVIAQRTKVPGEIMKENRYVELRADSNEVL